MNRMWSMFALAPLTALAIVAGACGGGGGDGSSDGAKATATFSPRPTMFPSPQISGNTITSALGYSATYPQGWRVRANFIQPKDAVVDAFFEPVDNLAVQANISVECLLDVTSQSPADRIASVKDNRMRLNADITTSATQVAGKEATVLSYIQIQQSVPDEPKLDKQDVLFSSSKCHWTIATVTAEGQRARFQPLFDEFLRSFKLTGG